jgi:hypothetical protein
VDINTLSNEIVAYILPFLPYLAKVGERAGEEAGKKFGLAAWQKAMAIWEKLIGHDQVVKSARDAEHMPREADAQAALRLQIKKLLQSDEALRGELSELWLDTKRTVGGDYIKMIVNISDHGQVGGDIIGKRIG